MIIVAVNFVVNRCLTNITRILLFVDLVMFKGITSSSALKQKSKREGTINFPTA